MTPNYKEFKLSIGGREVTVETGKYAEQTNGSCVVRCGETAVMVNVCMSQTPRDGIDFFPLQVDYEEKMYAVGKIPGGFKRREGRASDKAILGQVPRGRSSSVSSTGSTSSIPMRLSAKRAPFTSTSQAPRTPFS